jgi:hypothetical protein
MRRDLNPLRAAGRVAAEAEAEAAGVLTAIATVIAIAAVAGAEIRARVAGSRPKIIVIVPGSLASLAGKTQHVLEQV